VIGSAEKKLRLEAEQALAAGQYGPAGTDYTNCSKSSPTAAGLTDYRFFQALCDLQIQYSSVTTTPEITLDKTSQFLENQDAGLLKQHGAKAGEGFLSGSTT